MRLIESFVESKDRDPAACEDRIFESDAFVAVFDGATDKTDARYADMPGGRFAVEVLARSLGALDEDASGAQCIEALSEELRRAIDDHSPESRPEDTPSASAVIYSAARGEIWRVGDCSWRQLDRVQVGMKAIDGIVAAARAALLEALLRKDVPLDSLLESDPGREMVLPLLEEQYRFRNLDDPSCGLAFGALDGKPVPVRFIEISAAEPGAELVLATDGYPDLMPTLAESEEWLARDLAEDPLRIGRHKTTKAVTPGHASFDDRAYVRLMP